MRKVLKIAGAGCLTILVAGAILIAVNWDRITLVARNLGAMFDGVEEARALRSVDALLDFIDANRPVSRWSPGVWAIPIRRSS